MIITISGEGKGTFPEYKTKSQRKEEGNNVISMKVSIIHLQNNSSEKEN